MGSEIDYKLIKKIGYCHKNPAIPPSLLRLSPELEVPNGYCIVDLLYGVPVKDMQGRLLPKYQAVKRIIK